MASDIEAAGEQNTVDAQEDEDVMPTEVIKARLANFVAVRASRRRHVQLPLFALAGLLLIAGMCIFLAGGAGVALPFSFHWAEVALNASGMVIVLSAMPGDVRLLRSILVAFIAMIGFAAFGEVRPLLIATQGLVGALNGEAPGARERATLWLLMLSPCAKLIACVGSVLGAALLLAGSCIGRVSPLHMTTLCLYLLCVFYLAIAVANAFAAARAAIDPTVGRGPYSQTSRAELISVHVVLVVQGIIFGLTGLFSKRLRSRVHAFLAGRGVGVSAAAGIGELLNGVKAADVLRDASASFRAVSLDDLTYEVLVPAQRVDAPMLRVGQRNLTTGRVSGSSSHTALERLSNSTHADRIGVEPTPASSSGTIARHAELGQVDAFVSHSWHDPPDVKWKALQEWGVAFRAEHGRPPLLWIDSLCIDQSNIAAQLSSLPVYLAGCKTVLVLHGPTYLKRLWCVVELFVFFQAHLPAPPASKITLLTLDMPWETAAPRVRDRKMSIGAALGPKQKRVFGRSVAPLDAKSNLDSLTLARLAAVADAEAFDVRNAHAALLEDEEKLLAVIETSGEAVEHFKQWLSRLLISKIK